jgi:AcrR family transcriptional regulator
MPAKRRTLTRATVIAQAASMADVAGDLHAVTLAALAGALDVRTPSLYNHIAGTDDLRRGLTVHALGELIAALRRAAVGAVGREALVAIATAYRRFAHAHPGLYPLTVVAPEPGDAELVALAEELLQMLLLILASCGLHGEPALHAVRGLRALLHGFVSLERGGGYKLALDENTSFQLAVTAYLDGLALPALS